MSERAEKRCGTHLARTLLFELILYGFRPTNPNSKHGLSKHSFYFAMHYAFQYNDLIKARSIQKQKNPNKQSDLLDIYHKYCNNVRKIRRLSDKEIKSLSQKKDQESEDAISMTGRPFTAVVRVHLSLNTQGAPSAV